MGRGRGCYESRPTGEQKYLFLYLSLLERRVCLCETQKRKKEGDALLSSLYPRSSKFFEVLQIKVTEGERSPKDPLTKTVLGIAGRVSTWTANLVNRRLPLSGRHLFRPSKVFQSLHLFRRGWVTPLRTRTLMSVRRFLRSLLFPDGLSRPDRVRLRRPLLSLVVPLFSVKSESTFNPFDLPFVIPLRPKSRRGLLESPVRVLPLGTTTTVVGEKVHDPEGPWFPMAHCPSHFRFERRQTVTLRVPDCAFSSSVLHLIYCPGRRPPKRVPKKQNHSFVKRQRSK